MHQQQRARTAEEPLTPLQEKLRSGHDFLYGLAPVLAALTAVRRTTFYELFVLDRLELGDDLNRSVARKASKKAMEEEIVERARQLGVPVRHMDKGMLNTLSGNRPHQGFVLECTTLEMIPMVPAEQFQPATAKRGRRDSDAAVDKSLRPCWLALDEVWDPQNLGALLRSAYFLGCDGVMLTRKNSAGLTATVSKASSGAMEFMDIHAVSNMPQFLETAHRVHGWSVLGAALPNRPMLPDTEGPQGASRPCQQEFGRRSGARPVVPCAELSLQLPTILVLGNEGHGLRTNVERACTAFTYIEHGLFMDSSPSLTVVDSLNVSVAGAILMHRLLHGPA
jgi:21S rRNA (GM2251-2'-O)-methyltransferase